MTLPRVTLPPQHGVTSAATHARAWRSWANQVVLVLVASYCAVANASGKVQVGAIYYGDWAPNPQHQELHGPGWTEWEVVVNAKPKFKGHLLPNQPLTAPGFGSRANESDPSVMAEKITAATQNGIDFFMFDWYWYASPTGPLSDIQGTGGGLFLDGAVTAFMNAENSDNMKFALMWANQDWVDIHPAKKGWHSTYTVPTSPSRDMDREYEQFTNRSTLHELIEPSRALGGHAAARQLQLFDGFMSCQVYKNAFEYIAKTYFTRPNYLKVDTTLKNGTTAKCAFFSFYQIEIMQAKEACGSGTGDALAAFEAAAEAAGTCVHINAMTSPRGRAEVDSVSDYGWMKTVGVPSIATAGGYYDFGKVASAGFAAWDTKTKQLADLAYVPCMSVGWDSSPRTLPDDVNGNWGYPWGGAWVSTPQQFHGALVTAKTKMEARCAAAKHGTTSCLMLINAWNEWSECSYLEPDQRDGFAKLKAIGDVFMAA